MSRVMTFSRVFPKGHRREGEPTDFVPKIWSSLIFDLKYNFEFNTKLEIDIERYYSDKVIQYKHHTIRDGHNWKAGESFSPRVWSGKPYNSKQLTIAPDIEIKKTWDIEIDLCGVIAIGESGQQIYYTDEGVDGMLAHNDGLSELDFWSWLIEPIYKAKNPKPFVGQIICWNPNIEY